MTSLNMSFKKLLKHFFLVCLLSVFGVLFLNMIPVYSDEFTSASFRVLDPIVNAGGYGTSSSFKLYGVISQISTGTSTASSFGNNAGFLSFPIASAPVVTPTAGSGQISLAWTASTGFLGWTTSGYSVWKSAISGGPYTSVSGSATSPTTVAGLTNSVTYYFVVVAKDTLGNPIATSTEVSATPVTPVTPPSSGGGGGGGGSSGNNDTTGTGVVFSGRAYPGNEVTLLKDAQVVATAIADSNANFRFLLGQMVTGNYIFSLYSEDDQGLRSSLLSFPVSVTQGAVATIGDIFIAPTIAVDKSEVKQGDNIAIFGKSTPLSNITIQVNSTDEFFSTTTADKGGVYLSNFDTTPLEPGKHTTKSKAALAGKISPHSLAASFIVGTKNVAIKVLGTKKGDLNKDGRVDLVDFSILAFWYRKTGFPLLFDLNSDGKIDLVDFSIMVYYWTG